MARNKRNLISRHVHTVIAVMMTSALILVPTERAFAQYASQYPKGGYHPKATYYPNYWNYPPSYYYNPYGHTLLNDPDTPCVWEGRGCPTGR